MVEGNSENKIVIVCRCEDVSEEEIRRAIREYDLKTLDDIKRVTRAGMGLWQGRFCSNIIAKILSEKLRKKTEITPCSTRSPVRPMTIGEMAEAEVE